MRHLHCLLLLVVSALVAPAVMLAQEDRHYLTTEVGVGYSSWLVNHPLAKSPGLAGGNLQIGYEWQRRRFLLHTGLEFASLNSRTRLQPFELRTPYTESGVDMLEHFKFRDFTEQQIAGQVSVPVMAGGIFQDRYYFLAGIKVGMPVYANTRTGSTVQTTLSDPTLIGELEGDIPEHHVQTTGEEWSSSLRGKVNVQAAAEIGISINGFLPQKKAVRKPVPAQRGKKKKQPLPYYFRVALFCDYGITNALAAAADAPLGTVQREQGDITAPASVGAPREVQLASLGQAGARYNSLLVGLKFTALLQMNRPKVVEPPKSYLDVLVTDAETGKNIPARITIFDSQAKRETVRDAKNGKIHTRSRVGTFEVTASAVQHHSQKQSYTIAQLGENARLQFALQPVMDSIVEPEPVPVPPEKGVVVVLHNLYFATNASTILPESEEGLRDMYEMLAAVPDMRILIIGHTDDVGSERANLVLSENRAKAVKQALVQRGIAEDRIETVGKGESEPIAPNDSEEGRAENRRVEFEVL